MYVQWAVASYGGIYIVGIEQKDKCLLVDMLAG